MRIDVLICPTHGEMDLTKAAGCPECVMELRGAIPGKNYLLEKYAREIAELKRAAQAVLDNDDPADWPACYRELDRIINRRKS